MTTTTTICAWHHCCRRHTHRHRYLIKKLFNRCVAGALFLSHCCRRDRGKFTRSRRERQLIKKEYSLRETTKVELERRLFRPVNTPNTLKPTRRMENKRGMKKEEWDSKLNGNGMGGKQTNRKKRQRFKHKRDRMATHGHRERWSHCSPGMNAKMNIIT